MAQEAGCPDEVSSGGMEQLTSALKNAQGALRLITTPALDPSAAAAPEAASSPGAAPAA
jgi:hypothetical protein